MPIEIKITGNHATDVVAELQTLASICGVGTVSSKEAGATISQTTTTNSVPSQETAQLTSSPAVGGTVAEKPLTRKEQDDAVSEMIKAGAKDARFDKLTKGRKDEIEAALTKPAETADEKKVDADLDDMFADDTTAAPKVVTRDEVSALMAKVGKDKDGNAIQPRLLKIREILVDNIPEGQEIKVKSIPEDKLAAVYALIEKVGA